MNQRLMDRHHGASALRLEVAPRDAGVLQSIPREGHENCKKTLLNEPN